MICERPTLLIEKPLPYIQLQGHAATRALSLTHAPTHSHFLCLSLSPSTCLSFTINKIPDWGLGIADCRLRWSLRFPLQQANRYEKMLFPTSSYHLFLLLVFSPIFLNLPPQCQGFFIQPPYFLFSIFYFVDFCVFWFDFGFAKIGLCLKMWYFCGFLFSGYLLIFVGIMFHMCKNV